MPWNLLILPLIAGYYILTRSFLFKFKQQRLDRQRLIFESILLAVVVSVFSYSIRFIYELFVPHDICSLIYQKLPIKTPYIGTSFATIIISVGFSEIGNLFFDKEKYIKKAIKSVGNEFELILKSSFDENILIQITLDNDKFYIAWVKELPIPSISNYIRVIPAISGYRDAEKKLVFISHYLTVYSEYVKEGKVKDINELRVDLIINNKEIVSVSYFNYDMYERFNKLKNFKKAPSNQ